MSTSKHIDKLCVAAVAFTLALTVLFMCGSSLGIATVTKTVKYESTLFDTSYVHKIDIVMNDWDSFIETCENEEYAVCTVVVDGKKHANIAIRAKGNTSLSSVKSSGSQRYSFKLEFDHNESGKSLDGLDKLCLNNLIQDNTMMKDYLVYRMMGDFGVDSPLCSFVWVTVNGEDWGLYLAVEGVEDSFLARNYGSETGDLYKPDSLSFGGGRGNGKDFDFGDLDYDFGFGGEGFPGGQGGQESGSGGEGGQSGQQGGPGEGGGFPGGQGGMPGGFGGMGSDDVRLKYIDDNPDSYSNIFSSAKTDVSSADQARLIESLKKLSSYEDLEDVLDMDEVLRYFVVHNFVCNGDSYTGSMIHNYYLHEEDGKLGMIPWDYNLAFGTFQGGDASDTVNSAIDEPVNGSLDDRPMVGWIFSDESYTEQYHALFSEFIERWFANGELEALIEETAEMIRPCVEKDPTKFCTTEAFETGVETLSKFVSLRGEAVSRQLDGDGTAVETDGLNLSDMGSMGGGGDAPGGFTPSGDNGGFTPPSGDNGGFMPPSTGDNGSPAAPSGNNGDGSQTPTTPSQSGGGEESSSGGSAPGQGGNSGSFTPPSTGDSGSFAPPSGGQGGQGSFTPPSGDQSGQGGQGGFRPPSGGQGGEGGRQPPEGFDPRGGAQAVDSQTTFWILVGVSAAVLAAGLFIAVKKK